MHQAVGVHRVPGHAWSLRDTGCLSSHVALVSPISSTHARVRARTHTCAQTRTHEHTHTHMRTHSDSRSSKRSSSGAGSSCCTWRTFFRSAMSFPLAKIFWSLCFSFSRSPVGPGNHLSRVQSMACSRLPTGSVHCRCLACEEWASADPTLPWLCPSRTVRLAVEITKNKHQCRANGNPETQASEVACV